MFLKECEYKFKRKNVISHIADDLEHDFDDFDESNEEQIMVSFFEKVSLFVQNVF